MKIGRRGLFGLGAAVAAAPVAPVAAAKPGSGYGASPLMEVAGDFAAMTQSAITMGGFNWTKPEKE